MDGVKSGWKSTPSIYPFLKISEYGLIGNTRTSALVSNQGAIDWCCFPYHDSTSYFAKILDRKKGGSFSISPRIPFRSRQRYLEDTNVLETFFETHEGSAKLIDSFTVASEGDKKKALYPEYEILRILEGISGNVPFQMIYSPRPHYSFHEHLLVNQGKLGIRCHCGHDLLMLLTSIEPDRIHIQPSILGADAISHFNVARGNHTFFSATYSQESPAVFPALGNSALDRLQTTIQYWRNWSDRCSYRGEFKSQVKRSALTLKLLTFAPSGAIIAAPTSSLPEALGGVRNWDYRYCWLRDASFTVRALMLLGYYEEASAFVYWMLDTGCRYESKMHIFYSLFGEPSDPIERVLTHFEGYEKSAPVRIGNAARDQLQLDVMGEILDSVYFMNDQMHLDKETQKFLLALGNRTLKHIEDPDEGIWEVRARRSHHTHSKVMAWVALDRLTQLASRFDVKVSSVNQFISGANYLKYLIEKYGYNSKIGAYTQSFGSHALDASTLVMPLVGYCGASSAKMMRTVQAIRQSLSRNDLVYRYLGTDDGLPGHEGCFLACSFWLIDNLSKSGQLREADGLLRSLLSRSNAVALWPEEIDPESNSFLGNYPQGFTHTGLINSVLTLESQKIKVMRSA
jgi:GH15 family glucan-1,4-alpha-glucosidase